ncbi:NIPSNAP family containing protein [Pedobacter yulinensis]|uniref:NIPSNAP family containing protein n=1 Tax=Pedobacter yulinensis TaxID=2126353 RepID=A0A2T3HMX1_9SPHI|nr:NIPSNAP family protein [Pedobacter yulinensis]PST83776.1 NIPSNAP family containing protein [Pedobacter yulinensis]
MYKQLSRRSIGLLICALFFALPITASAAKAGLYQLKIYHLKDSIQQQAVENYLEQAYLPALHRAGITRVGVFKPFGPVEAGGRKLYVFIPLQSFDQLSKLQSKLDADARYQSAGTAYLRAPHNAPVYERIETILMTPFVKAPEAVVPALKNPKPGRVYELRSYEGPTEMISKNKIDMFNAGDEVGLFKRLGFNAVFYGAVVAGATMPNLMYMTAFEDKADRDLHWKNFGADSQWKQLSARPEYQKNVSKIVSLLLSPAAYSDF